MYVCSYEYIIIYACFCQYISINLFLFTLCSNFWYIIEVINFIYRENEMNKDKTSKKSFIIFLTATVSAILSVALRCVNFFFFFDTELGYYTKGAALPIVFNILLFASAIFFIVFSFIGSKEDRMVYRAPSLFSKILLFIPAILSATLAVYNLTKAIKGEPECLILMLISAFASLYFISDILKLRVITKIEFNILVIIVLTLMLAFSYFDQKVQMNSPDKLLFGLACISSMLFTVSELKVAVGTARPSVYMLSAASSILFGFSSAIPSIVAFHTKKLPESNGLYFEYYFILAMAIYATIRLFTVFSKKGGRALYDSAPEPIAEVVTSDAENESTEETDTNEEN